MLKETFSNQGYKIATGSRKRLISAALLALTAVVTIAGCAPELSRTEGVSIKKALHHHSGRGPDSQGGFRREGHTIPALLQKTPHNCKLRVISSVDLSTRYDFVISAEKYDEVLSFQTKVFEETFGLSIKPETREIPVSILVTSGVFPHGLVTSRSKRKPQVRTSPVRMCWHFYQLDDLLDIFRPYEPTRHNFQNYTVSDLTFWLEKYAYFSGRSENTIIVDETNLASQYNFELIEDSKKRITLLDSLEYLGLELKQGRRPITAIYVDKLPSVKPAVHLKRLGQNHQVYPAWEKP